MNDTINLVRTRLEDIHGKKGIKLFDWMQDSGYFEERASTKYHGNYEGGLVDHCINLYDELTSQVSKIQDRVDITQDDIFIIAFLHDLCKVGSYTKEGNYNRNHPKGHALLSLERIEKFITLTPFQRNAIKYHMGYYGTSEFNQKTEEYYLEELAKAQNDPRIKLIHWCDDFVSQFVDIKK